VLQEALSLLPAGVEKVRLRSDTAGYQHALLRYCEWGEHERFGRIEFAIGCDVTAKFKEAVLEVEESEWVPVRKIYNDVPTETNQQWAEVCFIPAAIAYSENTAWWWSMILALNLNSALKQLALGRAWTPRRMKEIRFSLIPLPGRIVERSQELIIRLVKGHRAMELLLAVRRRIQDLAWLLAG